MKLRNTKVKSKSGFTILEVMVALAIVGISIGIFFSLIANSSRLKEKIDRHAELLLLARTKTEEALLGILGKKYEKGDKEKTFEGTTKDGVQWKVSEVDEYEKARDAIDLYDKTTDKDSMEVPLKGTTLLSIFVGGIRIETMYFSKESGISPDESKDEDSEEKEKISDQIFHRK
ncbi:MAG: type II secretion system protein [Candidatus Brocadiaceae bacterium]|nr:type II secretion system protein [Candidatus Brocadiaceae bacterium]